MRSTHALRRGARERRAVPSATSTSETRHAPRACPAPVKVLHVLPDLSIGGGQTIVLQHVARHATGRFQLTVATVGRDQTMRPAFERAGASTVRLDAGRAGRPAVVGQLVRLIRERRIDLVHVHTDVDRPLGHLAGLLTGVPVVGHLHGEWVHFGPHLPDDAGPLRRMRGVVTAAARDRIERRAVQHYIAESQAVARLFRPVVDQPVTVLHQSVAVDEIDHARARGAGDEIRAELGIASGAPVLVTVARMVDGKGHDDLVASFRTVAARHPDVVLVMVGDGPLRPRTEALVRAAALEDRVRVLGDRTDVPDVLAAADSFVFASRTEGFGLVVLEAMAAALPVVAYDLPAFSEFAVRDQTALLAPVGDTAALAEGMRQILDDPALARRWGQAGRDVVDRRFPSGSVAKVFEAVYDQLCERS
jgi:glycosyltransferase involved in cell wall biosynthesis